SAGSNPRCSKRPACTPPLWFPNRLLLDSGGVDVIMSYNAICTSRIILEGLVFQEPYKRVEPSKRPCEHKTLESNKSLEGYPGQAGAPARPAGAELCEHAPAAGPETGQAAAPGRDD